MTAPDKRIDPAGAKNNEFIGRTDKTQRPSHEGPFGLGGQESLRRDQERWDFAKGWDDNNKQQRADFLKGLADKKNADQAQRDAADNARLVDELRRRYMSVDRLASEQDFQRDLPEILRQQRIKAALAEPATSPTGGLGRERRVF